MPRCSCAGATCGCKVQAGAGVTVTGRGTANDPYVIVATAGDVGTNLNFEDSASIDFTVVGEGTPGDPLIITAVAKRQNLPTYTTTGAPDPAVWGEGAVYYDTTLNSPLFSNGTAWVPAGTSDSFPPAMYPWAFPALAAPKTSGLKWYNDSGRTLVISSVRLSSSGVVAGSTAIGDLLIDGSPVLGSGKPTITIGQTSDAETGLAIDWEPGSYLQAEIEQVSDGSLDYSFVVTAS
jgi:hypothetical protein